MLYNYKILQGYAGEVESQLVKFALEGWEPILMSSNEYGCYVIVRKGR